MPPEILYQKKKKKKKRFMAWTVTIHVVNTIIHNYSRHIGLQHTYLIIKEIKEHDSSIAPP